MKIAVASNDGQVAEHFGHSQSFIIFTGQVEQVHKEVVPNPGHRPGFLPNFLHDLGVNVIITGGMGAGAIEIFTDKGIEVVLGVRGDAEEAARNYLRGNLQSSGSACLGHGHRHGQC